MGFLLQQDKPVSDRREAFQEVALDWLGATWIDGDFWRNIAAGTIVAIFGIVVPATFGWWWTKRKEKAERERKREFLYEVLFHGLVRNLIVLRRMRTVIAERHRTPEVRLHTGHFDSTVMTAIEALENSLDEYGNFVNAHLSIDHLNRRLDQMQDVEHLNIAAAQSSPSPEVARLIDLKPYVRQLLGTENNEGQITKVERILEHALRFLDEERFERELQDGSGSSV